MQWLAGNGVCGGFQLRMVVFEYAVLFSHRNLKKLQKIAIE